MHARLRNQTTIKTQLAAYLKQRSTYFKRRPSGVFFDKAWAKKLSDLISDGFCFGFSVCHGAMRIEEKLPWWDEVLDKILDGNKTLETFSQTYDLTDAEVAILLELEKVFERVIHYLVFNYADKVQVENTLDLDQNSFLLPQRGFFELLTDKGLKTVQHNLRLSGHFEKDNLIKLLKDLIFREYRKKNICLVHNFKHACELDEMSLFDPNDEDGKAKTFKKVARLAEEIHSKLGKDLAFEIVFMNKFEEEPHVPIYDKLNEKDLLKGKGLLCITKRPPQSVFRILNAALPSLISEIINQRDGNDWTALMLATQQGHETVVTKLLEHGVAINQANKNGSTPLMFAAGYGHELVVTKLLDGGASQEPPNCQEAGPLYIAAQNGHATIVKHLLTHPISGDKSSINRGIKTSISILKKTAEQKGRS